ncbi:hypothetical protein POTOM_042395 [Populus tomentosa]|uniref:peptidylprolyl isomerase n=1 Tax=Populus tomentosa TaxID=118781 RepID=A0A8X7YJG4_POPTO|nr:hypothetical protein POTOM_042395 [Populus tomentosa]
MYYPTMLPQKMDKVLVLLNCFPSLHVPHHLPSSPPISSTSTSPPSPTRRALSLSIISLSTALFSIPVFSCPAASSATSITDFLDLPNSGGVKALDLRIGSGPVPDEGDQVAIHYYGRLAAKQGWRFDSTYDHKDSAGEPVPFVFTLGSGKVRVIIPPSQGYQNTTQEPIPPNFFDRQRLFTTIFNPTRLANGEGSTLGTLIFDIELVSLRNQ